MMGQTVEATQEKMQAKRKALERALRKEGEHVPAFIIKLWQIRIKENFGLEVDSGIAEVIVRIVHERSTWKLSRAERYVAALLELRGEQKKDAEKKARRIVQTVIIGHSEQQSV